MSYFNCKIELHKELCNFLHGNTTLTVVYSRNGRFKTVKGIKNVESILVDFENYDFLNEIKDSDGKSFCIGALEKLEEILNAMIDAKRQVLFTEMHQSKKDFFIQ